MRLCAPSCGQERVSGRKERVIVLEMGERARIGVKGGTAQEAH